MDSNSPDIAQEAPEPVALKRLRRFIAGRRDLVSTGHVGRQIARLVSDPGIRTKDLVDVALADPSVVVRLIRTVNGASYQTRDRSEVFSIQRAIELIGQEQVRETVRSLPEIDKIVPEDRYPIVVNELGRATFCARFTRNFLDTRNPLVSDEGAVLTIMASLWSILRTLHLPHETAALRFVERNAPKMFDGTHRSLFALAPLLLNKEIVESWGLPAGGHAILVQTEQRPAPVIGGRDWLPLAVGISLRVADAVALESPDKRDRAIRDIVLRYRRCVDLSPSILTEFVEECAYEAIGMERSLGLPESKRFVAQFLDAYLKHQEDDDSNWDAFYRTDSLGVIAGVRAQLARRQMQPAATDSVLRTSTGKPVDSAVQLHKWARQFDALCSEFSGAERLDHSLHDESTPAGRITHKILPVAIEGIQRSMGYDRVVWFARDEATGQFSIDAHVGAPIKHAEDQAMNSLNCDGLFLAALIGRAEIHISDCTQTNVSSNLPEWFSHHFPSTRSFLLLPVSGPKNPHGFLLADRSCTDPFGLEDAELSEILTMRDLIADLFNEFSSSLREPAD